MFIKKYKNYDERLLEGRMRTEASVLGCIFKDFDLIEDYKLEESDFITKDALFLYKMAKKINEKKITEFTDFDLLQIFQENIVKKFEEIGGFGLVNSMKNNISLDNVSVYIDELYKSNAILKLYELGFCLTEPVSWRGKNVIPIELFKKFESQQVKEFYDDIINDINVLDKERGIEEEEISITDEFLNDCYSGEELGTLFNSSGFDKDGKEILSFPKLSSETGGFLRGSLSMLAGYSSVGKSTILISLIMSLVYRGEKICIISNEQKSKPFIMNFLMWILCNRLKYYEINKKKLRIGDERLTEKDKEMISEAQRIFNEEYKGKIFFISIPDANMKLVEQKFRQYHLRKGCGVFIYDTFKIDFNNSNDNFWLSLIKDSRSLDTLAKKYNSIAFATLQCANNTLGQLFLDSSVLSNSKQIKEILENLYIVRDVYEEEKDENSIYYCRPYRLKKNKNGDWKQEKVNLEQNKSYKMVFIDKVRNGNNSTSGNYAVILSFDGSHGIVNEFCLCHPQRKRILG